MTSTRSTKLARRIALGSAAFTVAALSASATLAWIPCELELPAEGWGALPTKELREPVCAGWLAERDKTRIRLVRDSLLNIEGYAESGVAAADLSHLGTATSMSEQARLARETSDARWLETLALGLQNQLYDRYRHFSMLRNAPVELGGRRAHELKLRYKSPLLGSMAIYHAYFVMVARPDVLRIELISPMKRYDDHEAFFESLAPRVALDNLPADVVSREASDAGPEASDVEAMEAALIERYRGTEGPGETVWGMTSAELRELHPSVTESDRGVWTDRRATAGYPSALRYEFVHDRLARVDITISQFTGSKTAVAVYDDLRSLLSDKYGPPGRDTAVWRQRPEGDERSVELDRAVRSGDVELIAEWATEETGVRLVCRAGPVDGVVVVEYDGLALREPMAHENRRRRLEDL